LESGRWEETVEACVVLDIWTLGTGAVKVGVIDEEGGLGIQISYKGHKMALLRQ
jgi:hypothetical protein